VTTGDPEARPGPSLDDLLARTSRTFALSIPLLPRSLREQVTLAYLLFRIADTFEDATRWPPARRIAALGELAAMLGGAPSPGEVARRAAGWLGEPPLDHDGYLELLARTPEVVAGYRDLPDAVRAAIRRHLLGTIERMSEFVASAGPDGTLHLADLADLRRYCYAVAGIVGEMLTDLFLLAEPGLGPAADELRRRSATFGEGLQLVNVLKDSAGDAREGRRYLPAGVDRADVFRLARADLDEAAAYTLCLQRHGASRGLVAFNALPLALARATLAEVEARGPGSKVSRATVAAALAAIERALDAGEPAVAVE